MIKDDEKERAKIIEDVLQSSIDDAWDWLVDDERGRLVLWSILDKCQLFSFPFYGNSQDALHRGRQQVADDILHSYVYSRGMSVYTNMLLEAEARQKTLERAIEEDDQKHNEEN